jgi:hypothetical protein
VDLGDRLQRWWDRVRGYEQATATARNRALAAGPAGARAVRAVTGNGPDGTLNLAVESKPLAAPPTRARSREAGFNPYESTGAYQKPRGWDDVPRK